MTSSASTLTRLNRELQERLGEDRNREYDNVEVYLICWEDGDQDFKGEAQRMELLFRDRLGYPVSYYMIPSEASHLRLQEKIVTLALRRKTPRSLTVIHYGGHGDDDDENDRKKAVWAAHDQGEPTLVWSDIQPTLGQAQGDILLILDCCFAAQSARDRSRIIPPNTELMAACAMKRQTRKPGPRSFTAQWIKAVTKFLDEKKPVVMSEIHHQLASGHVDLPETPIHFSIGRKRSIQLEPYVQTITSKRDQYHQASLTLEMMLGRPLGSALLQELLHWLGDCAPKDVLGINIANLVDRTVRLQNFVESDSSVAASDRGRTDNSISPREEIRKAWGFFIAQMEVCVTTSVSLPSSDWGQDRDQGAQEQTLDKARLHRLVSGLCTSVDGLQKTIERVILSLPELHDEDACRRQLDDSQTKTIGLNNALEVRLRTLALPNSSTFLDTNFNSEMVSTTESIPSHLVFEKHPRLGTVIIEYNAFERNDAAFNEKLIRQRMDRLATVLKSAFSEDFCILQCLGCLVNQEQIKYGLVFSSPHGELEEPISLYAILSNHFQGRRDPQPPTLGQRFQLALRIGRALLKWHCVGWLHQSIASYNIIFFKARKTNMVDFSKPYICGFNKSRETDGTSSGRPDEQEQKYDVYRHPERQGWPPAKMHQRKHDLYSFGLLLLEIGLWAPIPQQFSRVISKEGRAGLRDYVLKKSEHLLRRDMGTAYEIASRICLSGQFGVSQDDEYQSELARAFEVKVLNQIALGVGIDGHLPDLYA
jgi:hypothetical protein